MSTLDNRNITPRLGATSKLTLVQKTPELELETGIDLIRLSRPAYNCLEVLTVVECEYVIAKLVILRFTKSLVVWELVILVIL